MLNLPPWRRGSLPGAGLIILLALLFLCPGQGAAYEWMDQIQDRTSLQVPMEILWHPLSDLSAKEGMGIFERLETDWFLRKRAIAVGDRKTAATLLDVLKEEKIDAGAVRIRSYAASLLREARALAKQGAYEEAAVRCRDAMAFAPGLPEPHRVLAGIHWKWHPWNPFPMLAEWGRAVWAAATSLEHAVRLVQGVGILLVVGCFLFFGVFYGTRGLRDYGLLKHDLAEIFPRTFPVLWLRAATLICLFLPLLLGGGIYALCLFWVLLFWSYGSRKERVVHILFLVFTALLPFWGRTLERGSEILYGEEMQALLAHREGDPSEASLAALVRLTREHPEEDLYHFLLGTARKKRGDYAEAEKALKRAIAIRPGEAIYYNNLGNAYYALRDLAQAVKMYEKGILLDDSRASLYFNLSAAHREQFLLNRSDEEYFKARSLDPALVSYYVDIIGPSYNRMVVDETLSRKRIVERFLARLFPGVRSGGGGVAWVLSAVREAAVPLLILALLLPLHYLRTRRGTARRCVKCGDVFCRRCQTRLRSEEVCSQCTYIFEEQSGVDVKQRTGKIIQIRRHMERQRERARLFGIVIPGAGDLFTGRFLRGFLILTAVGGCLGYALFGSPLSPDPMTAWAWGSGDRVWALVPALILYGLSLGLLYAERR